MSRRDEPRDRCPTCNLILAKLYDKKPGGTAFSAYKTPAGQDLLRCIVHGPFAKNAAGALRKVAVA